MSKVWKKANLWAKLAIVLLFAGFMFGAGALTMASLYKWDKAKDAKTYNGQALFEAVNAHRAEVGVQPLKLDNALCSTLNERVDSYIKYGDHTGVEEWVAKRKLVELGYTLLGEDLVTANSASEALSDLLGSPGHRLSIENPERNVACTYVYDAPDHFGASVIFLAKKN